MTLLCVAHLWTVIDNDERFRPAITVLSGYAVCEEHMHYFVDSRFNQFLSYIQSTKSRSTS
jgi:hypothetical protein